MTRHTIIFALTILISSCGNRTEISNETILTNDTTIPFYGLWTTENYINTLTKTRSPRQSQDDGEFFHVPQSYKDRAFTSVYHEGGGEFHIIKHKSSFYLKSDFDKNDSSEIVFTDNGNRMKVFEKLYVKTLENVGIPEDLLFKGNYSLEDKHVSFNANGTIEGLDSIKFYSIENDYIGPGMGDLDIIYLGKTKDEKLTNCFQFVADTLFIFNIKCLEEDDSGNCLDIQRNDLKFKLVKK